MTMRDHPHHILPFLTLLVIASLHAHDYHVPDDSTTIRGEIEITVCYEVVPGGEFACNIELWNPGTTGDTATVALRLDLPDGRNRTLFTREITLDPEEMVSREFHRLVPGSLDLFGRYTMLLIIDDLPADSCEFDLNSREEIVSRWDDGELEFPGAWDDSGNIWAIRGCMPDGAIIDEIGARLLSEGDPYWPWPDAVHQPVELEIYDDDGPGGLPGTLIWTSGEVYVDPLNGEVTAYPGIPAPAGSFFAGNQQLTPYPFCEGQGQDSELDYPERMFARVGGEWQNAEDLLSGDLMIWAVGHIGVFGGKPLTLPMVNFYRTKVDTALLIPCPRSGRIPGPGEPGGRGG